MSADYSSILVIVPNWLGDVAMATPAIRTLRQRYPNAKLIVTGPQGACALLSHSPHIDVAVPFDRPLSLPRMLRAAKQIRAHKPELAVVLPHSFRAALLATLARVPKRLGYNRGQRGFLLTETVEPNRIDGEIEPVYMVWEYLDLLKPLECDYDGFGLDLHTDPSDVAAVAGYLEGDGPLVGFAPGAAFGPSKRWPVDRYANVADHLSNEIGARCVLLTGPGEEDTRDQMIAAASTPFIEAHGGKPTIGRLKAAVSQLDLLIGNDSGPRHVAIAFDVPMICIMGSTSPKYSTGPYEKGELIRIDVDCGPCQKPACPERHHMCMTGIDVDRVVTAARAALGG